MQRLKSAATQLFAQADLAEARGERRLAQDLARRANELRAEFEVESARCAARIRRRVNAGKHSFSQVDLHGMHVEEALQQVDSGLRQLPRLFPGGILVRYITGRGRHSENGAQVKPAVVELLGELGADFTEGPGYVDVTIQGADA